MTVSTKKDGNNVTALVEGRIDSNTAPEFEKGLTSSITGNESLVIDFSKLEYISSAGLRVLLSTHKKLSANGSMIIKNVNDVVYEVFEITGFSEILKIEK